MEPIFTANHRFSYHEQTPNGMTLICHAKRMHDMLIKQNGWKSRHNKKGSWGNDINICRIGWAIRYFPKKESLSVYKIASLMHDGWCDCFDYWITHKPWKDSNRSYQRPCKLLENKITRSCKYFDELGEYQKDIYFQMAEYVIKNCF
jgi:hypothetical protein